MQKILPNINKISTWATIIFLLAFLMFVFLGVVFFGVGSGPEWWQMIFYVVLYPTGIICIVSYFLGLISSIREGRLIPTIIYFLALLLFFTYIYVSLYIL